MKYAKDLRRMTMKIKWIGKYDGKNLPTVDVGTGAKELPEVTSKSAIMARAISRAIILRFFMIFSSLLI